MTEKVLLVGGTGFLGSFVARRLADRPLAVLARPSSDVSVLPSGAEIRSGALEDPDLPLQGISTVVYCASMGFGHVPPLLPKLESVGVKRSVFISTTAIFTHLPAPSRTVRQEAEAAVQASALEWTILRPTMIYGSARDRNISRLLRFVKRWPVVPLCGNGLWQPIYVEDLADAVVAALDTPRTVGQVYNLGGACPLRFSELIHTAASAIARRVVLARVPVAAAILGARLTGVVTVEQVRRLVEDKAFDCSSAARDFGFRPRSFAEGVRLEAQALGLRRGG